MAKRNGKVNSVPSVKNCVIEVPDDAVIIVIPRTKPIIPHEKKRRKTSVEEIYMSRVAKANELVAFINSDLDDGEGDFVFGR